MKHILTLFLLAGFFGCGASSPQIGGEFADFRKPAGLYLGMNADDCGVCGAEGEVVAEGIARRSHRRAEGADEPGV